MKIHKEIKIGIPEIGTFSAKLLTIDSKKNHFQLNPGG